MKQFFRIERLEYFCAASTVAVDWSKRRCFVWESFGTSVPEQFRRAE